MPNNAPVSQVVQLQSATGQPAQQAVILRPVSANRARQDTEIDLVELFYKLLENLKWIIGAGVAGALLAAVYTLFLVTPMYESTAGLYVLGSKDSVLNLSDLQLGTQLAGDYQVLFKTWEVSQDVVEALKLNYTYKQVRNMVTITNETGTRILFVTAKSSDPKEAQRIANQFAISASNRIAEVMDVDKPPNMATQALVPESPVSPNKTRNVMMGGVLGAMLAVGVIFLRFVMDDKIKSAEDIQKHHNLPTLAVMPMQGGGRAPSRARGRKARDYRGKDTDIRMNRAKHEDTGRTDA